MRLRLRPLLITSRVCSHSGGLSSATEAGSAWQARGVLYARGLLSVSDAPPAVAA